MGDPTWQAVTLSIGLALIAAIPGIIAAYYSHANRRQLVTGNDKTVGEMVTDVHGAASIEQTSYDTHSPHAAP